MTRYRNFVFTINNYTRQEWFKLTTMDMDWCKYFIMAQEVAPTTGTPHIQGYVQLSSKISHSTAVKWISLRMGSGRKPYVAGAKGSAKQNINYVKGLSHDKVPNKVVHEWGTPKQQGKRNDLNDLYESVKKGLTDTELCEAHPNAYMKYYKAVDRVRANMREQEARDMMAETAQKMLLKKWQAEAVETLDNQNDREVLWVSDPKGNSGKTMLAKFLIGGRNAFYIQNGKCADIAYAYNYQKYVVFDFTKSQEEHINYSVIESFKNGILFSPKYNSSTKFFEPCKVIVFSNFRPELNKLSADRWRFLEVEEGGAYITPTFGPISCN